MEPDLEEIFAREYDRRMGQHDTPSYMSVDTLEGEVGKVMNGEVEQSVKESKKKITQLTRSLKPMRKRLMSLRGQEQADMIEKIKSVKETISNHKAYIESYDRLKKGPVDA